MTDAFSVRSKLVVAPFSPRYQKSARNLLLAYLTSRWGTLDPDLNRDLDDISASYAHGLFVVALCDGQLVGTGALVPESAESGRIVRMAVAPTMQRQGVGRQILRVLCDAARQRGYRRLVLETTADWRDAAAFYTRCGFQLQEIRDGDAHFALGLSPENVMQTPEQQKQFFETFGYLILPGLVRDEIGWITNEFESVFQERGARHDGSQRTCVVPFIDQRETFCALLDNPKIVDAATSLLGEDWNYLAGDGNYYTGDTGWHSDGFHTESGGLYLKVAFYLDPVGRDTGCLRVIPGSHRPDLQNSWQARQAGQSEKLWGIAGRDVPAIALESTPGDVVVFNHNLMHTAFGGGARRRMFTLNLCRKCETPDELADLERFINDQARFWIDTLHSPTMRRTASPERMRHLRQVMEHEGQLPLLAARARAERGEPSRG